MSKCPAFQFYPGDWLKDPALSMCSPATRGIWMDLLCAIHERNDGGSITGSRESLQRLCRCTPAEMNKAINELQATGAANIEIRNEFVTIVSRRMKRDQAAKKSANERVREHRFRASCNGDCNSDVTQDVTAVKRDCNADVTGDVTQVKQESNTEASSSTSSSITEKKDLASARSKEKPPLPSRFHPPSLDEIRQYITENPELANVNPEAFWKYFTEGDWIDSKGNKVRNWKQKLRTWSSHSGGGGAKPDKTALAIETLKAKYRAEEAAEKAKATA